MKNLNLIVWLTQLGLSVAFPLAGFILLAVWLRSSFGWGDWVIWVGLILGLTGAVNGFRQSQKAMELQSRGKKKKKDPPPVVFNEHI